jgi:transposase-like protein
MLVRFRYLKVFLPVVFLANIIAFLLASSVVMFFLLLLTLAALSFCIQCPQCHKSPFIIQYKGFRIGSAIPETTCSNCGFEFTKRANSLAQAREGSSVEPPNRP